MLLIYFTCSAYNKRKRRKYVARKERIREQDDVMLRNENFVRLNFRPMQLRQFPKRWIQPEIVWDRPEVTQSSQVHHKKSFQPQTMYQIIDISTLWVIIMTHIKWIIMNREKYTEFTCTESWWVINKYPRVIMSHNDQWMNHDKNDE